MACHQVACHLATLQSVAPIIYNNEFYFVKYHFYYKLLARHPSASLHRSAHCLRLKVKGLHSLRSFSPITFCLRQFASLKLGFAQLRGLRPLRRPPASSSPLFASLKEFGLRPHRGVPSEPPSGLFEALTPHFYLSFLISSGNSHRPSADELFLSRFSLRENLVRKSTQIAQDLGKAQILGDLRER